MPSPKTANLYQGVPMDQRRAGRRAALIQAAIAVYGERGYRAATVKSVCDAAGLTERYFYESFSNSEALLAAAYETVIDAMLSAMRLAAADAAVEDRPAAVLRSYYEMLRQRPEAARVFLVEIAGVSPAIDHVSGAALKGFGLLLDEVVNVGAPQPASPALLRAGIMGGVIHIALRWIAGGYAEALDVVLEQALRLCGTLLSDERPRPAV